MFDIRKLFKDEKANAGTIIMLVMTAVGILALAIVLSLGPSIGYSVGTSVSIPTTSQWSPAFAGSTALNGSQLWVNTTPMIGSGAMVVLAALIIAVLLGAFMYTRGKQ